MYIKAKDLPKLIPDNDFKYFTMLEGIVNSVDNDSVVEIVRKPNSYGTRISPKILNIDLIIKEITKFHTYLGIYIDLSKSIKASGKIYYEITLE